MAQLPAQRGRRGGQDRPGDPDFLTVEAQELIDGQYADRPHLRPVLDAVLALLPEFGPVTAAARAPGPTRGRNGHHMHHVSSRCAREPRDQGREFDLPPRRPISYGPR